MSPAETFFSSGGVNLKPPEPTWILWVRGSLDAMGVEDVRVLEAIGVILTELDTSVEGMKSFWVGSSDSTCAEAVDRS